MSDFTDATIGRYVDQNAEQRKAYALDPAAHMRVEALRQTLDAVERAMAYEDIPEETRRRVINRVVWGEPEGYVDARARVREQVLAAYDLPTELTDAWKAIHAADGEASG